MSDVPAHLATRRLSRNLTEAAVAGLAGANPPHVSIRQNRFRLVDAAGNEKLVDGHQLDLVVVDVNPTVSKIYFENAFDPSATEWAPPACFSDNGEAPSTQALKPQAPLCMTCPKNAWGSDVSKVSGKPTKACNDLKKIAVVVEGDSNEIVYLLRIPPATLKNWKAYVMTIGGHKVPGSSQGLDLPDVVTRVSFDEKVQGVLTFQPVGWASEATVKLTDRLWEAKATDQLVGKTDVPRKHDALQPVAQQYPEARQPAPQLMPPPRPPSMTTSPGNDPQMAPRQPEFTPPAARPLADDPRNTQQAGTALEPPPPRPRGRPRKEVAEPVQPPAAQQAIQDPLDIPPFLNRKPAGNGPAFGMQAGQAPDPGLKKALDDAFKLPT